MRYAAIVLAGAVLLAGCGSSKKVQTSSSSSSTSSMSIPDSTAPPVSTFVGGTSTVSTPVAGHGKLTAVRVATQQGYERVVFEFDGPMPGYSVGYVNRPVQEDASGKDVPVQGDSILEMRLVHASGVDLSGGQVNHTYTGPKRMSPGGPTVAELVEAGDFEGVLRWVAGTHGKPAFKVSTLANPTRVVVDLAAP
jgi:hypothetical protein